jgi:hypothetical protein
MAMVFLVHQPALDRYVVLKRLDLDSDDPRLAQRFVQEARLAARLDHPNIVTLFDFFEDDAVPYIAMEYVAGGSLRPLVGALSLPQVFGVAEGLLAALRHAERHGIAHRDLKPENVLLTDQGRVKIADFGIARAYNALTGRLTSTGMAVGTPAYMAPEQAQDLPLGPQTDLYAVGVIVYELLMGRPPFEADTPVAVLYSHVHRPPPPLTSAPVAVRGWVEWLLAKSPADRPRSAREAWDALEEIAVAELGPYWRRDSAIYGTPSAPTEVLPEDATTAPAPQRAVRQPSTARLRRSRMLTVAGALVAVGAGLVLVADDDGGEPVARPARVAMPYDFDGDGRQELVAAFVTGSVRGDDAGSGAVLLHDPGRREDWSVITAATAGVPGEARRGDEFGTGLASGDFNADGHADLAVGMPGKDNVSVLYGSERGPLHGRKQQLAATQARLPRGGGRYGYALLARDFDRDRFDDLVVGAPGGTVAEPDTGALHLLFGSREGLQPDAARALRAPEPAMRGFGSRLRAGDVDADGHVDLVEGARTGAATPGHATYCAGSPTGPAECRRLGSVGASSLGVADVNGDGRADVVEGHVLPPATADFAGEVLLWLGGPEGPSRSPIVITQETRFVRGNDEADDQFGAVVDAGDVDGDGFADMLVAAPGENDFAGAITVIRGGRSGIASTGHSTFGQDSDAVPGRARPGVMFGSALTVLQLSDDRRPDLAVAARGEGGDERIMVVEGGAGVFAPDETRTDTLTGASRHVRAGPRELLRLARTAGG